MRKLWRPRSNEKGLGKSKLENNASDFDVDSTGDVVANKGRVNPPYWSSGDPFRKKPLTEKKKRLKGVNSLWGDSEVKKGW